MSHDRPSARLVDRALVRGLEIGTTLVLCLWLAGVLAPLGSGRCATESTAEALSSRLATMRQAIAMYYVQHDDQLPDVRFVEQLCRTTDRSGGVGPTYGPYLRNGIPLNPVTSSDRVEILQHMPGAPRRHGGWVYCVTTGEVRADGRGESPDGRVYWEL